MTIGAPNAERGLKTLGRLRELLDMCPATETILEGIEGDELITFFGDWGFVVGREAGGVCIVVHPDHADLDLTIPMVERVSYRFVVAQAVELVDDLISR